MVYFLCFRSFELVQHAHKPTVSMSQDRIVWLARLDPRVQEFAVGLTICHFLQEVA